MPSPTLPSGLASLEQGVVDAVNAQRRIQGLPPYPVDEHLTAIARAHAQDMVTRGYFDHVTPEGKTLRDRLRDQGIEAYWAGENIQRNSRPANETVQFAMDWFMGSEPHRKNILHAHYDRMGVGVVEGPPGMYTFVLVFVGE